MIYITLPPVATDHLYPTASRVRLASQPPKTCIVTTSAGLRIHGSELSEKTNALFLKPCCSFRERPFATRGKQRRSARERGRIRNQDQWHGLFSAHEVFVTRGRAAVFGARRTDFRFGLIETLRRYFELGCSCNIAKLSSHRDASANCVHRQCERQLAALYRNDQPGGVDIWSTG